MNGLAIIIGFLIGSVVSCSEPPPPAENWSMIVVQYQCCSFPAPGIAPAIEHGFPSEAACRAAAQKHSGKMLVSGDVSQLRASVAYCAKNKS